MEIRTNKVLFSKNSKGNPSPRMPLSLIWLKKMGVTEDNREVQLSFDGKRIIIEPSQQTKQETV